MAVAGYINVLVAYSLELLLMMLLTKGETLLNYVDL